jgi:hypothetical protein
MSVEAKAGVARAAAAIGSRRAAKMDDARVMVMVGLAELL